jgi:hypothetical protein
MPPNDLRALMDDYRARADRELWAAIPPGQVWYGPVQDLYEPFHPLPAFGWRCNIDACPWTSGVGPALRSVEAAAADADRHRRTKHPATTMGAVQPAPTRAAQQPDHPGRAYLRYPHVLEVTAPAGGKTAVAIRCTQVTSHCEAFHPCPTCTDVPAYDSTIRQPARQNLHGVPHIWMEDPEQWAAATGLCLAEILGQAEAEAFVRRNSIAAGNHNVGVIFEDDPDNPVTIVPLTSSGTPGGSTP